MELHRILNAEDRSRLPKKSSQTRSQLGSSRSSTSTSTMKSSSRYSVIPLKVDPSWNGPLTPIPTPTDAAFGNKQRWTASPSRSTTKRPASSCRPASSSSSSSSSSPAPPTPISINSTERSFATVSHPKTCTPGGLPSSHQMTVQPPHVVHTSVNPLHTSRILPPPLTCTQMHYSAAPMVVQYPIIQPVLKQPPHQSHSITSPSQTARDAFQRTCSAVRGCDYITPKRRIVSQFFGRNKKETRLIPKHCWVFYCRQHYQRSRYRCTTGRFAQLQMSLVRATVEALEKEHIVVSWEIKLRKRALEKIEGGTKGGTRGKKSGSSLSKSKNGSGGGDSGARERLLVPYCGSGKSFKHVYVVLDLVTQICERDGAAALEFEILPSFMGSWIRSEEDRRKREREAGNESDSESDDDD